MMQRVAAALDEEERQAVAGYYASLPLPDSEPLAIDAQTQRTGRRLADAGKWSDNVPACVRCHGADGNGVDPFFPPLAGQYAGYLEHQLKAWKNGSRRNEPVGLMQHVAHNLSDAEITAVSRYFASLQAGPQQAAGAERARRLAAYEDDSSLINEAMQKPENSDFESPPESRMPEDELGKAVLFGKQVFVETRRYADEYTGNSLSCVNCHLNHGRHDASAPMGPAFVRYPRYRGKNQQVNTMEQRIQGCFTYSENGAPPPSQSEVMKGLVSYFSWLATGAPANTSLKEAKFAPIDDAPQKPDPQRGAKVFAENCAICHSADGEGTRLGERHQFPPLWGEESFNWGAGMHRINTAAAFIYSNMPLALYQVLSVQEAWDVAAYINSYSRPQDPRFDGDVQATRAQFHDHNCYYGSKQRGKLLGGS